MGQYFYVINLTKKEYLYPHKFGDGLKLMEFGASGRGTMLGLALLLRQSSEGGGGDYHGEHEYLGRWAGDQIAIVGDYDESNLYQIADESYTDISWDVLEMMLEDEYVLQSFQEYGDRFLLREAPKRIKDLIEGKAEPRRYTL